MWILLLFAVLACILVEEVVARSFRRAACAVLLVLAVATVADVASNLEAKGNPPASCEEYGGSWDPWTGWSCA